jgi:hypothetical protein
MLIEMKCFNTTDRCSIEKLRIKHEYISLPFILKCHLKHTRKFAWLWTIDVDIFQINFLVRVWGLQMYKRCTDVRSDFDLPKFLIVIVRACFPSNGMSAWSNFFIWLLYCRMNYHEPTLGTNSAISGTVLPRKSVGRVTPCWYLQ